MKLLMLYNFLESEPEVTAPNFYKCCAENVFPQFGVENYYIPNFKEHKLYKILDEFGFLSEKYKLFCTFLWLAFHGHEYDVMVGWLTNGIVAGVVSNLLKWKNTKVVLILYQIKKNNSRKLMQVIKNKIIKFASDGATMLLALDKYQSLEFEKALSRKPGFTKSLKYGVDYEWYQNNFDTSKKINKSTPVIFSPGSAHRDEKTLEKAVSDLSVTLLRYQINGTIVNGMEKNIGKSTIKYYLDAPYQEYVKQCINSDIIVISVDNADKPVGLTSLLEVMSLGCAIIITDGASSRDYIINGVDGLTYENGNHLDLKKKIEYLLENHDIRINMAKAAAISAKNKFSLIPAGGVFCEMLKSINQPTRI